MNNTIINPQETSFKYAVPQTSDDKELWFSRVPHPFNRKQLNRFITTANKYDLLKIYKVTSTCHIIASYMARS